MALIYEALDYCDVRDAAINYFQIGIVRKYMLQHFGVTAVSKTRKASRTC